MEEEQHPDEESLQQLLSDLESNFTRIPPAVDPLPLPTVLNLRRFLSAAEPSSVSIFFRALISGKSFPLSSFVECLAVSLQPASPAVSLPCSMLFLARLADSLDLYASGFPLDDAVNSTVDQVWWVGRGCNSRKRKGKKGRPLRTHGDGGGYPEGKFDRRLVYDVLRVLLRVMRLVHLDRFPDCFDQPGHPLAVSPFA